MSVLDLVYGPKAALSPGSWGCVVLVLARWWLRALLRPMLEVVAVVDDILEREDFTAMALFSGAGIFFACKTGDLVSESPATNKSL